MNLLAKRLLTVVAAALLLVLSTVPAQASTQDLQRRLNELGCDAGPVDGVAGAWTRSAVVRFAARVRADRDPDGGPADEAHRDHPPL